MEPSQVELLVDGENDPCSKHEDINFQFKGFSLLGQVKQQDASGADGSLDKIVLTVSQAGKDGETVQKVSTDADGAFSFPGLLPGDYVVRLSEESLQSFSFKVKEQKVTVKDGSVELAPFVIMGYDLEGSVVDPESSPIAEVSVALMSAGKAVATVKSDKEGKFVFASVPRGAYTAKVLAPKQMSFDAVTQEAKVFDKNVILPPFRLSSFDLSGTVLLAKGKPAAGIIVQIQQKGKTMEAVTNDKGIFTAKSRCICEINLLPVMDEAKFDKTTLKVNPGTKLPTLSPNKFRASGSVEGGESMFSAGLRVAFLKKGGQGKTSPLETTTIDAAGHFSAFLPPGTFTAEIQNESGEKESVFTAKVSSFEVVDGPVSGVLFQVARFSVSGVLKCFNKPCNAGVEIRLRGEQVSADSAIEGQVNEDGKFVFKEVPFGKYELELVDDTRCWKNTKKSLKVDRDHSGIEILQKGTVMSVDSTHPTNLILTDVRSKAVQSFEVVKGSNVVCVDGDGDLEVSANGCYKFTATPNVVNTKTDKLSLRATSFKVSGSIKMTGVVKDVKLTMKSNKRENADVKLAASGQEYKFEFFIDEDEAVTLIPSSEEAFFAPQELNVRPKQSCELNVASFSGRKGHFIVGSVKPAVEGVKIETTEGSQQHTLTKTDGSFRLGPFAEESRVKLAASKEGYSFEETGDYGLFKAQVLSSISIKVVDEKKNPIPDDAVVSISSGKSFRSSSHLKDGALKFPSLLPGEYFIKVFLKEWVFEPKHVVLNLKENSNLNQELVGRRVAYSLFGRVNYPNNKPASGVVVLAQGKGKCADQIEDASSSAQGTFRLRGLEPGCQYELKPGNPSANTFVLTQPLITMEKKDYELSSPILTQESPDSFHLAVKVKSPNPPPFYPPPTQPPTKRQISVEARSGDKIISRVFSVQQDSLQILPALPAGMGTYTVILDGLAPQRFTADAGSLKYLTFQLKEEGEKKQSNVGGGNVYFSFLVAAVIAGGVVYKRSTVEK